MTEIQQNRYDQLVRRVNNIVSPGSMVGDALNELFPMINVETLNAELAFLASWKLAFASVTQTASMPSLNHAQLFNPADSRMLVVLERVDIRLDTAQTVRYAMASIGLTNLTANHAFRDSRPGILEIPIAQARDVQQAGGLPLFGALWVRDSVNETLADKRGLFVLAPGTGITFATTVSNTDSQFSFLWRERVGEPSELNF